MLFCVYQAHFTKTRCKVRSLSRPPVKRMRVDSDGRSRSMSRPPRDEMGIKDSNVSISKYCKFSCLFPISIQKIANCYHKVFLTSFLLIPHKIVIPENGSQRRVVTRVYSCFSFVAVCTRMAYPHLFFIH